MKRNLLESKNCLTWRQPFALERLWTAPLSVVYLQSRVNGARTTAVGGVAGDISEEAFFLATRAYLWRGRGLYGVAALTAFPVGVGGGGRARRVILVHDLLLWQWWFFAITLLIIRISIDLPLREVQQIPWNQ